MKKVAAAAFFAFFFLASVAQAADEPAGFAGIWVLDKEKSDAFPRSQTATDSGVGMGRGGMGMPGGGMGGGFPGGGFPGEGRGGRGGAGTPGVNATVFLVIEQKENEVKLTVKSQVEGKEMPPYSEVFTYDGKRRENMISFPNSPDKFKQTTKAALKKNNIEVEQITYYPQMQVQVKRVYSLSKDGKTLIQKTTNSTLMTAMSMVYSTIQKQVYNRR
jgi:hypothetical protein